MASEPSGARKPTRATTADKIVAMPFPMRVGNEIDFPLASILSDDRWVLIAEGTKRRDRIIAGAGRMIRKALTRYWQNRETPQTLTQRIQMEAALERYGLPLLKALDRQTTGRTQTPLHFAISSSAGVDRKSLEQLHISLRGLLIGLGHGDGSRKQRGTKRTPDSSSVELDKDRLTASARKAVGRLKDPAGHLLTFELTYPFATLSGSEPTTSLNSEFAQFVAATQKVYVDLRMKLAVELDPTLSKVELHKRLQPHHIADLKDALRWGVAEWKRTQRHP